MSEDYSSITKGEEGSCNHSEREIKLLYKADIKYKASENEIENPRTQIYNNWDSVVDEFGITIQNFIHDVVRKFIETPEVNNFQNDETNKETKTTKNEDVELKKHPRMDKKAIQEKNSKEFETEMPIEKYVVKLKLNPSLSPRTRIINLGIDFFYQLLMKLRSCQKALKRHQVVDDINMGTKQRNNNISSKVKHLNEKVHILETILRVHHILTPEKQGIVSKNKRQGYEDLFKCQELGKQNRTPRDNTIARIIDELLGRHDVRILPSYGFPHMHQITLDPDLTQANKNYAMNKVQVKQDSGLYHAEWKKKIIDDKFSDPCFLYNYLIESEENRIKEPIYYSPISIVIETFIEEYACAWKKIRCKDINHLENKYQPENRKEKEEYEYYPHCHFCDKILLVTPQEEYCCADAKLLNLIKKKVNDPSENQLLAAWEQSMLKKIAEKAENLRVQILIYEGQNFLKGTAQKMNLTCGEVAKLLLAVAIRHQKNKEDKRFVTDDSETSSDDPGEGIVDKRIEPLWRKVTEFDEEQIHSEILEDEEDFRHTTPKENEVSEKHSGQQIKRKKNYKSGTDGEGMDELSEQSKETSLVDASHKEEIKCHKEQSNLRMKEQKAAYSSSEISSTKEQGNEKIMKKMPKLPVRASKESKVKERVKIKREPGQSPSSELNLAGGKTKRKIHQNDDAICDKFNDDNIPPSTPSVKKKGGFPKSSSQKFSGKFRRSPSKNAVTHEYEIQDDDHHSKDFKTKFSKMSSKHLKDRLTPKVSKILESSKSSQMSAFSVGKQIEKTGAKIFGFIPFRLSDAQYSDCGWSPLPKYYHTRSVNVHHTIQGKKNILWVKEGAAQEVYTYTEGSVFSILRKDGTGEIFYPNGTPAIVVGKERKRIVVTVLSHCEANPNFIWVVGKFDSYGHGIIYDNEGKVRMQFTQTWGLYRDLLPGKFMRWTWGIGRKDALLTVPVESKMQQFSVPKVENQDVTNMPENEDHKTVSKNPYCPIPFLTIHLNNVVIFRLFEQQDMCLIFNANMSCFRLELGVIVDPFAEAFSESYADHEIEKEENIALDMSSIHDELMPPPPTLPDTLPLAPSVYYPTLERRKRTLLHLHRAIKINEVQEREEVRV